MIPAAIIVVVIDHPFVLLSQTDMTDDRLNGQHPGYDGPNIVCTFSGALLLLLLLLFLFLLLFIAITIGITITIVLQVVRTPPGTSTSARKPSIDLVAGTE